MIVCSCDHKPGGVYRVRNGNECVECGGLITVRRPKFTSKNCLLSFVELCELVDEGIITGVKDKQINASSIDITLGDTILAERFISTPKIISLKDREPLTTTAFSTRGGYVMSPGEFVLAHSQQTFNLPNNISAEYKLKSSMARMGLEHLNAGWCDAGWNGSVLTLELKNMTLRHRIQLEEGDAIGQIVFFKHETVPKERSYAFRGRYNNDTTVTGVKS